MGRNLGKLLFALAIMAGCFLVAVQIWRAGGMDFAPRPALRAAPAILLPSSLESSAVEKPAVPQGVTAARFQDADDYKALYESLMRAPGDSSGLYATHILSLCSSMRAADFQSTPAATPQQDEAQKKTMARCGAFTAEEVSGEKRREALKDPRNLGRLAKLRAAWTASPADPAKRDRLLADILAAQDPLLLESIGPTLLFSPGSQSVVFQGRTYSQPYAVDVVSSAWMAAACEATLTPCAGGDPLVLEACATRGTCVASRQALMQQTVGERHGKEGAALYALVYPALVTAIRAGDAAAFAR